MGQAIGVKVTPAQTVYDVLSEPKHREEPNSGRGKRYRRMSHQAPGR